MKLGARSLAFDDLLLESVDEVFTGLLGEHTKEAIYIYLESKYYLKRDQIPSQPDRFLTALCEMSGKGGRTMGRAMMKRLFEKLGWQFHDIEGFEPIDYLEAAKLRLRNGLTKERNLEEALSDLR